MYKLTIDNKHADVIIRALDLYSRLLMAQVQMVPETIVRETGKQHEQVNALMQEIKHLLFQLPYNASYGITSKETPENAKIAVGIHDVIRHCLAWEWQPEGGYTVDFDTPMNWSGHALPEIHKK